MRSSKKTEKTSIYQAGYLAVNELRELFAGCKCFTSIDFDEKENSVRIVFNDRAAADIFETIFDPTFGYGEDCPFGFYYEYDESTPGVSDEELEYLFRGSEHFSRAFETEPPLPPRKFIGFKKEVVQYNSDDFSDPNGVTSTLAATLAKKYLSSSGYCAFTEIDD